MLVSTFELLVKNILPAEAMGVLKGRTIIQGYFLTISNTSNSDIELELQLVARTPRFRLRPDPDPGPPPVGVGDTRILALFDIVGANVPPLPLPPDIAVGSLTFDLKLGPRDTGLFILQPNVTKPSLIAAADTEIRGYSQISLKSNEPSSINVLLTPEHRGTFLTPIPDMGAPNNPIDFDQLVYSLPTARGRSLYELS
jgi:hypothetical protein